MHISLITLFALLEVILFLLGATITLGIMLYMRKSQSAPAQQQQADTPTEQPDATTDAISLDTSYIDYLEQALQRNNQQMEQQPEDDSEAEADTESENNHQTVDAQLQLLQARQQFLELEKAAAQKSEDEDGFWQQIHSGMQALLAQFRSIEVHTESATEIQQKKEVKEKVFYVETQGRKVDNEVNKLKDIIHEQENALFSMQKNLAKAIEDAPQESESLNELHQQFSSLERQILDSKMCMDILEAENERLQDELHKINAGASQDAEQDSDSDSEVTVEISQIKEVVRQQKERIKQLLAIIETLEIDTGKAEELKTHLGAFTRSSEEMMSCITILEEENERLQDEVHTIEDSLQHEADDSSESQQLQELQAKISELEEEIVKKDLALAQLQEEFSSMETEYLAMYEAMQEGKQQ